MTGFDVVTLGETMLRLTPPGGGRLDQATNFDIEVGGTESNTAVGLSRLGLRCAWISRLPNSPLGEMICEQLNKHGVNTSYVARCDEHRVGVYFYEDAAAPRLQRVVYDRLHSAASYITPDDVPANLFADPAPRLLHMTGITPAISDSARHTTHHIIAAAQTANVQISFDTNYRMLLWSPQAAREEMTQHMNKASIILTSLGDLRTVFGVSGDQDTAFTWLSQTFPDKVCVLTLGNAGAMAQRPDGQPLHRQSIATTSVGRLGGGDAFNAGFLYGWLSFDESPDKLARCLDWGVAAASLKYATPGDMAIIDKREVAALLERGTQPASVQR